MATTMMLAVFQKARKTHRFFDIFGLRCSKKHVKPGVFFFRHFGFAMFQEACKTQRFFNILDLRSSCDAPKRL